MTTARLHDGRVLKFDNSLSPSAIQAAIREKLKGESQNKKDQTIGELKNVVGQLKRTVSDAQKNDQSGKLDAHHKDDQQMGQKHNELLQVIAVGLHQLLSKMPDSNQILQAISTLSSDIRSLERAIHSTSSRAARIALSPVDAERDSRGRITRKTVDYKGD